MKRTILVYALLAATAAALGAQQASQTSPYEGTSNPPPDNTITTPNHSRAGRKPSPAQKPSAQPTGEAQPASPAQFADLS